ncbi:hypothetical protein ACNPQM_40355, partial [Streptomyces sp. NPDC056231]|uniref:hypothetical protein n=1 Tax=Streptomyces sp. NPDC056231 TaxID=3345755 RepID=UPI003AAB78E2
MFTTRRPTPAPDEDLTVTRRRHTVTSRLWHSSWLRREALLVRVEVKDLHQHPVAAGLLKLRAA